MPSAQSTVVLVIDVQADFTEYRKGSLAVPGTAMDYVDAVLTRTREFKEQGLPIIATRDYHPPDHISFFTSHPGTQPFQVVRLEGREQILWPPHCVQDTPGVEILLPPELITNVVSKGCERTQESYSAFRDDAGHETGLKDMLRALGTKRVIMYGLATDYCVRCTALHARDEGFDVQVILGLSRGVTSDGARTTMQELLAGNVTVID